MDAEERTWWRLLDELPASLSAVHRWRVFAPPPQEGPGGIHPNPTAMVCLAGVVRARRGAEVIDLGPGEALLIDGGVWHQHEAVRPGSVFFGQGFLPTCSDVVIGGYARAWSGRLPSDPSRQLMAAALDADDDRRRCAIFADLVRQVLAESVTDLIFKEPALMRMINRLWSQFHRDLTTTSLLAASGLSRAQAYRLFTAAYGVPPKRAIESTRLWLAEALLAAGTSAGEAARASGFSGADQLRRARRRAAG